MQPPLTHKRLIRSPQKSDAGSKETFSNFSCSWHLSAQSTKKLVIIIQDIIRPQLSQDLKATVYFNEFPKHIKFINKELTNILFVHW